MARKWSLSRRAFLAGVGGTAVSLPLLQIMLDNNKARAALGNAPKRYLVCFAGMSLGQNMRGGHPLLMNPDKVGAGYDLKPGIASLAQYGNIKNEITVVTGLELPSGEPIPPGGWTGREGHFHNGTVGPLLSGMRVDPARPGTAQPNGPTSDQIVAEVQGGDVRPRGWHLRGQDRSYALSQNTQGARMSYRRPSPGDTSPSIANDPFASPRAAYRDLFTGFTPSDPADVEKATHELNQGKSVIDLVRARSDRLMQRLGNEDRTRMQQHYDEILALERRMKSMPGSFGAGCFQLPDPGNDPPYTEIVTDDNKTHRGWSDEDTRIKVMSDLVHMAFVCDLTRVATLMYTHIKGYIDMTKIAGVGSDLHEIGHGAGEVADQGECLSWLTGHFGRLVSKMRDTPELDGSLLNSTAAVMVFEGGYGFNADTVFNEPGKEPVWDPHSAQNMVALIAGRVGGLNPGRHVKLSKVNPSRVILSAMKAVGVDKPLGEVTQTIPELFV